MKDKRPAPGLEQLISVLGETTSTNHGSLDDLLGELGIHGVFDSEQAVGRVVPLAFGPVSIMEAALGLQAGAAVDCRLGKYGGEVVTLQGVLTTVACGDEGTCERLFEVCGMNRLEALQTAIEFNNQGFIDRVLRDASRDTLDIGLMYCAMHYRARTTMRFIEAFRLRRIGYSEITADLLLDWVVTREVALEIWDGAAGANRVLTPGGFVEVSKGEKIPDTACMIFAEHPEFLKNFIVAGLPQLQSVILGNSIVGIPDGCFAGCASLRDVCLGSGVKAIETKVFAGCGQLQVVRFGANAYDVHLREGCFRDCGGMQYVVGAKACLVDGPLFGDDRELDLETGEVRRARASQEEERQRPGPERRAVEPPVKRPREKAVRTAAKDAVKEGDAAAKGEQAKRVHRRRLAGSGCPQITRGGVELSTADFEAELYAMYRRLEFARLVELRALEIAGEGYRLVRSCSRSGDVYFFMQAADMQLALQHWFNERGLALADESEGQVELLVRFACEHLAKAWGWKVPAWGSGVEFRRPPPPASPTKEIGEEEAQRILAAMKGAREMKSSDDDQFHGPGAKLPTTFVRVPIPTKRAKPVKGVRTGAQPGDLCEALWTRIYEGVGGATRLRAQ
jgi:hypothetical protein